MSDALVVGAGWAGLAAAVGLVQAGRSVTVLEAAPQAGGRARTLRLPTDGDGALELDNGQHLMIGAYRSMLALMRRIGVDEGEVLTRSRLRLNGPAGFSLSAAPLPAPLHLLAGVLTARGLPWRERLAMARAMAGLRRTGPAAIAEGTTVARWLDANRQPAALVARLWGPLCIGALNTPPERACARAFAQVLCDALLARASDSDFLLPHGPLGTVLPEPACRWLQAHGARIRLRTPCRGLAPGADGGWRAEVDGEPVEARQVVLAVPPGQVARLLAGCVPAARLAPFEAFGHEPIATVWLAWREALALPASVMLAERPERDEHGQWLFGRALAPGGPLRCAAGVVISAAGRGAANPGALTEGVSRQVGAQLGLPAPAFARAIVERRATIRCSPDRPRIDLDALADVAPGLALAGDWSWHRYPATIESAVRSGDAAALWLVTGRIERP